MNHQEYLPFHAQLLWECAKELNYVFCRDNNYNDNIIEVLSSRSLKEKYLDIKTDITSPEKLLYFISLPHQARFAHRQDFTQLYLHKLLSSQQEEEIHYFIENGHRFFCAYDCSSLTQALPLIDEDTLTFIFNRPITHFPSLGEFSVDFKKMISALQSYPEHIQWINHFLKTQVNIGLQQNYTLRDDLIFVFPTQLEEFRAFPPIHDYLTAQETKLSPFIEDGVNQIFEVSINQTLLQQCYSLVNFTMEDYDQSLEAMLIGLTCPDLGVFHHDFNYIYNTKTNKAFKQYTITIHTEQYSMVTRESFKEFLHEFYSFYLKNLWDSYDDKIVYNGEINGKITEMTPKAYFHFMTKKNLPEPSDKLAYPKI